MESFKIENLSFTYPKKESKALENINLTVNTGEFVLICGKSGCGKTTLLRLLKSQLSPVGQISGSILFNNKALADYDNGEQASKIGFVMQSPDNQIVTDKVWHELAFGLESLGCPTDEIRARVSETASFFGIQAWFHKNVTELSGGQKQLLNLASVMVMQPTVLILDEPTSQLDPIAAQEFLNMLKKINRELGVTVIISEHRTEEVFPLSDTVVVMDNGKIIANDNPKNVCAALKELKHDMYLSLPAPSRIYGEVCGSGDFPITVREGKAWLEEYAKANSVCAESIPTPPAFDTNAPTAIEIKDAWFRYEKNLPDVIKGLNLNIKKGELFCILGGNGTGKTTALSLIADLNTPYRGKILINGVPLSSVDNLHSEVLGVLPQNPQSLFVKKTVLLDLEDILAEKKLPKEELDIKVRQIAKLCKIENLLNSHPYDLSGGEQQRAALAKILLLSPQILLLDEPTKGMDSVFKEEFADILAELTANNITVVMVSHDIEFCAKYSDRCAMFFDGSVTSIGTPREFFAGKTFYTTSANRMARKLIPNAVLAEDIMLACGSAPPERKPKSSIVLSAPKKIEVQSKESVKRKPSAARIVLGIIFAILFVSATVPFLIDIQEFDFLETNTVASLSMQLISIASVTAAIILLALHKPQEASARNIVQPLGKRKLTKRTLTAALMVLAAIPLTIYVGIYFLSDRKYYFISLLIILETTIPFFTLFESRKPQARELIVISVLCATAVAGRVAFYMLPQFKPVAAIVIIAAVCFGGETGFLVGAVTGFVSNFFFGQGPWTPWQMFAFGMIGFIAGVLFQKGFLRKNRLSLCIFGFFTTILIYGGITNPSYVILMQDKITLEMLLSSYALGLPFDLIHGLSTAFFLWFISEPMIDKLERIKEKYGLLDRN